MISALQLNFDLVKWELFITGFLLIVAFLIARGKSIKHAVAFFVVSFLILALAFAEKCFILLALDNPTEGIRLAVAWGPTVIFALTLVVSTLLGIWRGFRKSALLTLHAVCAAAVCLVLFFVFTRSEAVDRGILNFVDKIVGDIRGKMGVSAECSTMREVLAEWIPSLMNYGAEVQIVLRDNGAYLMTLVDMAYRIVFALLLYFLYLLLIFILYIVYHAAYSEHKYMLKKEKLMRDNRTDRKYCKHRLGGGIVGLARGLAAGLISLSFLGSALFVVADIGRNNITDANFGNDKADFAYSVYSAVGEYGDYGIFGFLNSLCDDDDQPYYLFAADLIFSGKLEDDRSGISANIKFRKEIGAYSKFMRQTMDLLIRYGGDAVSSGDKTAVMGVFQDESFQLEFESLIDEFDTQTYFINFALSAATSLLANIDDTSLSGSMSETNRELMKIMFSPGYLSDYIPDELALKQSDKEVNQPYIGIPQLYDKSDAKIFYKIISSFFINKSSGASSTVDLVRSLLPQIQKLSVFSSGKESLDPVIGRVYCYMANTYLKGSDESAQAVRYGDVVKANVNWMDEIYDLISVIEDGFAVYDAFTESEGTQMDKLLSIFDEESENYAQNIAAYDNFAQTVESSKMLGKILSTGKMYELLSGVFSSVSSDIYIPRNITYENGESGNGELHWLLYGLKLLGSKDNRDMLASLTSGGSENAIGDVFGFLTKATENKDEYGATLSSYMTESVYLRSLISSVMIENKDVLYVPDSVLEKDGSGKTVRMVRKEVLSDLFECMGNEEVGNAITEFLSGEESNSKISALIENDAVAEILCGGNGIIEGTVALQLADLLEGYEKIRVPSFLKLKDGILPDEWLTVGNVSGELGKLVRALRLDGVNVDTLLTSGRIGNEELKLIMQSDSSAASVIIDSDILHYSMSDSVLNGSIKLGGDRTLIVPVNVKLNMPDGAVITKAEMKALCKQVSEINITSSLSSREVVSLLIDHKDSIGESAIVSATMANFIVSECDEGGALESSGIVVPASYMAAGRKDALEKVGSNAAKWSRELTDFAIAAEILFGSDGDINVDGALIGKLAKSKDDLETVYKSRIIGATFTSAITKLSSMPITDHPNAYEKSFDKEIYRLGEVNALLFLTELNGLEDLNDFRLIDASYLKRYIYDADGNTESWLITATLSDRLLKNESLYIGKDVLASDGTGRTIKPSELAKLIDAYVEFNGNGNLEDWNPNWTVPAKAQTDIMLDSVIVRSSITREIRAQYHNYSLESGNRPLYILKENVTVSERVFYGESAEVFDYDASYISKEQLSAMFAVLNATAEHGESFLLPEVGSMEFIFGLSEEQLRLYIKCDTLRRQISQLLGPGNASESEWYRLTDDDLKPETLNCYTEEQILDIISTYTAPEGYALELPV